MNNKKNEEDQLFRSITFNEKLLIYLFFFISLVFVSFILTSFKFSLSNADSSRYMISALIQSEATIFAIVITLSLVAVQQSATSYSPRVIEIFKDKNKNPDFWILIIIYLVAMLYSALVLKLIDDNLTPDGLIENNHASIKILTNIQTHIWMTYFMSFFAFVSLISLSAGRF